MQIRYYLLPRIGRWSHCHGDLARAAFVLWPLLAVPINAHGNGDAAFIRSVPGWRFLARLLDRQISTLNLINNDIDAELDALGIVKPLRTYIPNGIAIRLPIERHAASNVRRLVWTGRFEAPL